MTSEAPTVSDDPEDRFHEALASFEQARDDGLNPDPAAWLARYPDVADRLREHFAAAGLLKRLADPPPEAPAPPPAIKGYRILEPLGRGGMGVVYRARQVSLNRPVALKMILAGQLASSADVQRFRTEAANAAGLDHPHIVSVYEVGEHGGQPYFTMKLIEGASLAQKVDEFVGHPRVAARLMAQVAAAVHHAHQRGILHRDLKPSNILLDADGEPHVTDFGLAKRVERDSGLTQTGAVVGTPSYMAPEQARAEKRLTTAADVYGLGAILYHLLTGRPPFRAETPVETVWRVLHAEATPPRALNPHADRDLEIVCLKCLEKEPHRRYASAQELADDLERWLRREPIHARPSTPWERARKWARRKPAQAALAAVSAAAAVALLVTGLVFNARVRAAWQEVRRQESDVEALQAKVVEQEKAASRANLEADKRLNRVNIGNGARLLHQDDWLGAGVWYAEALQVDAGKAEEQVHRLRLANVWRHCPRLVQVVFEELPVRRVAFSPDGSLLVTACGDWHARKGGARVWDAATGLPASPPLPHDGEVRHAGFSPDGRRVVTVSGFAAHVWDVASGRRVCPPLAHKAVVGQAAFSPDGSRVVTACWGHEARVWDAATGRALTPPLRHGASVVQAAFSPDGRRVVTASDDKTARVWDAATGKLALPPLPHDGEVHHAEFSPEGGRIVTAGHDRTARVWDAASGKMLYPPLGHDGSVRHAVFSPDGRSVVTAAGDWRLQGGEARVWAAATGRPLYPPLRHDGEVHQACFSPDGRAIATSGADRTARVWDAATGRPLAPFLQHDGEVWQACFSPDGRRLATASADKTVRLWDTASPRSLAPLLPHDDQVWGAVFSQDGRRVATVSRDRTARVWDAPTGRPVSPPLAHDKPVTHAAFSPDGGRLLTADGKAARVWDAASVKPLSPPRRFGGPARDVCFGPGGPLVLAEGPNGALRVWDAATGQAVSPLLTHPEGVRQAAFSPDGRRVVTAGWDKTARVWDAATGKPITKPLRHDHSVCHAAFSPDGRRLITGTWGKVARAWDVETGRPLSPPLRHNGRVEQAAFSPDGRRAVTVSSYESGRPAEARVWDVAGGALLFPPLKHEGVVHACFSPDGRCVVTAGGDWKTSRGEVRLWDAATGQPLGPPLLHGSEVRQACFSPDGRRLVTAGAGDVARVWDVAADDRPIGDLLLLARLLANRRLEDSGGLGTLPAEEVGGTWRDLRTRHPAAFAPPSAEGQLAWHRHEADTAERAGHWFASAFHLDRLLAADPREAALYVRRGRARFHLGRHAPALDDCTRAVRLGAAEGWAERGWAYAELGQWDQARADFAQALARGVPMKSPQEEALLRLLAGDKQGYQRVCAGLVQPAGKGRERDPSDFYEAAWACTLAPEGVDLKPLLGLVHWLAAGGAPPGHEVYQTFGLLYYRAGHFDRAASMSRQEGGARDCLVLAMACHRRGRADEARRWLDKAAREMAGRDGARPLSRTDRLALLLLRREAEALLQTEAAPGK
jgi:eukaryotic-like serine/threonine-protein kinase